MMLPRVLKYVKGAVGETDVPDAFPEFISQRRRWLNGSLFAATYAIAHVGQILRSGHSLARKTVLTIETIYNVISLIFSWFSIVRAAICRLKVYTYPTSRETSTYSL
jgi:chitin synthase